MSLSTDFVNDMKKVLEEKKERLEKELAKFTTPNPNDADDFDATFPQYGDDQDANAHEVADFETNKNLERTLEKELRDVNKALDRIAAGSYGQCKYCDKYIAEKRLIARPTSNSCVDCKKLLTQEA